MRHPFRFPRKLAMLGFSLALILLWLALPQTALADGTVIYVDIDATTGLNNGTSWRDAYITLQAAPADASANSSTTDEIWVAQGVYLPGKTVSDTFTVPSGVALYGGFFGNETLRTQRNWTAHVTVLSGDVDENDDGKDVNGVVPGVVHIRGDNAYHVVWMDGVTRDITATTRLDGFTITGGGAASYEDLNRYGGGLHCNGTGSGNVCSPVITNVTFRGNGAGMGGALYNNGTYGGRSSPQLTNVVFISNAANFGGAVVNEGSGDPAGDSSPVLMNVTFSGNWAATQGCTLANFGTGGASNPTLTNVIVWGACEDARNPNGVRIFNQDATTVVTNSLVQGGYIGTGNINVDPRFFDAAAGNVDLENGSPAIDAGTNTGAPNTDIRGWPRPYNGITDMGAYEQQPEPPILALTKQVTSTTDVAYHGVVTYTLILGNNGVAADTNVALTDTLPTEVNFGAWVENPGATVTADDLITWSGDIAVGAVITVTFTATHTGAYGDIVTNTAWFSGSRQAGNAAAVFTVSETSTAADLADVSTEVGLAGVTISWRTADECNLLGFHLYRGTHAADPSVRLNSELIPAQGLGGLGGFDYSFFDAVAIAPGTHLVYWLETVDFDGTATRHGPFLAQALAAPEALAPRLYLPTVGR